MPVDTAADSSPSVPEHQRRVDELVAELRVRTADHEEALQREAAVAEVLQVNQSCPATSIPFLTPSLRRRTACAMRHVAACSSMTQHVSRCGRPRSARNSGHLLRQGVVARQFLRPDRDPVQVDMVEAYAASPDDPVLRAIVKDAGLRTVLFVPLHKEGIYLGRIRGLASRRPAILRKANRAAGELRGAGSDRDRKCPTHQRDARGAGAADGDGGNPACDLPVADRRAAGVRSRRQGGGAILRRERCTNSLAGWRHLVRRRSSRPYRFGA